jgi:hypothetical protein
MAFRCVMLNIIMVLINNKFVFSFNKSIWITLNSDSLRKGIGFLFYFILFYFILFVYIKDSFEKPIVSLCF